MTDSSGSKRTGPLSPDQVRDFQRDGFVVARGLISGEMLERAMAVSHGVDSQFETEYDALAFESFRKYPALADLALSSDATYAAVQLTPTAASGQEHLHLLRDALFVFSGGDTGDKTGCGWHVDDPYFWPATRDSSGPGVNVWIALDEVTDAGGGLALALGSHTESFMDCRKAIEGGTCQMATLSPQLNQRLEDLAVVPQMKPGDAIIHTRWLFHRTNGFSQGAATEKRQGIARYTARYMPASAVHAQLGQRLDAVDSEKFPQVH